MEKIPKVHNPRVGRRAVVLLLVALLSLAGCGGTVDTGQEAGAGGAKEANPTSTQGVFVSTGPVTQVAGDQSPAAVSTVSARPTAIDIVWNQLPGDMRDIGIGGVDENAMWAVGGESVPGGFEISVWTGSSWDVVEESAAVAIDVGPTGYPWIVTRENRILEWTGAEFVERPGTARDIGIGADGSVWIIGTDPVPGGYSIHRWNETSWDDVPGGAVAIDVAAQGDLDEQRQAEPWMVNAEHQISRWDGSEWQRLPGEAQDIGVGANGAVWIIGTAPTTGGYSVATWNGDGWASAPGGGVRISVNTDGFPVLVTDDQQILQGS